MQWDSFTLTSKVCVHDASQNKDQPFAWRLRTAFKFVFGAVNDGVTYLCWKHRRISHSNNPTTWLTGLTSHILLQYTSDLHRKLPERRKFPFCRAEWTQKNTTKCLPAIFNVACHAVQAKSIIDYDQPDVKFCDPLSARIESIWSLMNLQISNGL